MESNPQPPPHGRPGDNQPHRVADTVRQDTEMQQRAVELSTRRLSAPAEVRGLTFIDNLGNGAYGTVWLARERNTGKHVAVKFYTHRRNLDWSLLNREVEKLVTLLDEAFAVRRPDCVAPARMQERLDCLDGEVPERASHARRRSALLVWGRSRPSI